MRTTSGWNPTVSRRARLLRSAGNSIGRYVGGLIPQTQFNRIWLDRAWGALVEGGVKVPAVAHEGEAGLAGDCTGSSAFLHAPAGRVAATCGYAPCRKFPISRHPPIRSKKWPCAQPNASEATHFWLFNFQLSLPLFLFSQIVLRSALNELDFQP
jgi:hypothetical protein